MKNMMIALLLLTGMKVAAADPPPPEELTSVTVRFFELLKKDKVEQAYDELLKSSKIDEKKADVAELKDKTREALKTFGPIYGFELLEHHRMGFSLMQLVYFTLQEERPLRWRMTFYRPKDKWRLVNIQMDDQAISFFEPTTKEMR